MAAFDLLTTMLASVGDNVVTAASLYSGTYTYLEHTAVRRSIEARFVDTLGYDAYAEAIGEDTMFVHCETVGIVLSVTDGACPALAYIIGCSRVEYFTVDSSAIA